MTDATYDDVDVDASAMPAVPRGNTNAPTVTVAEKAADEIRKSS